MAVLIGSPLAYAEKGYSFGDDINDVDTLSPAARYLNIQIEDKTQLLALFIRIIGLVRTIFWILVVVLLIYAAYLYLAAGASGGKTDQAKTVIKYAVVAMIIAMVATSIPYLIRSILM